MTVLSLFLLQTFLILSTRFGRQYVFRFSKEKSLFLFGPLNVVRKAIIILITNQYPFSVTSTNGVNYLLILPKKWNHKTDHMCVLILHLYLSCNVFISLTSLKIFWIIYTSHYNRKLHISGFEECARRTRVSVSCHSIDSLKPYARIKRQKRSHPQLSYFSAWELAPEGWWGGK